MSVNRAAKSGKVDVLVSFDHDTQHRLAFRFSPGFAAEAQRKVSWSYWVTESWARSATPYKAIAKPKVRNYIEATTSLSYHSSVFRMITR